MTCKKCKKVITRREKKLNAGLCDACLALALRAIARDIARKKDE